MQEVIQCTGGMEGAILSFGSATSMPGQLAADLIASMLQSQTSRQGGSPRARSNSPRRANYLPHRTTQDMLDQLWHASGSPSEAAARASADAPNSLQIGNLTNAVVVSVNDLSPAVLSGLECADAVPFLILRWINTCLVEVRVLLSWCCTVLAADLCVAQRVPETARVSVDVLYSILDCGLKISPGTFFSGVKRSLK